MSPRGADPDRISAAFLDRDGTLVRDTGYLSEPDDVELLPGAARAVRALNRRDIPVVIVTNQSGIGRGYFTGEQFEAVRAEVRRRLARRGARVDLALHCPHVPDDGCGCRKPELGMYRRAARKLGLDLTRGLYVGDSPRDVEPASRTDGIGLLVRKRNDGLPADVPTGCRSAPDLETGLEELLGPAPSTDAPGTSGAPPGGIP